MKRNLSNKAGSLGLALVAATAIACSGGGGGSDGSSATSGNATVSGNVTNASTALRSTSSPTLLARLMRFLSPVTSAIAAQDGLRVLIHALETMTDGSGSFVISGVDSGAQTITFTDGTRTFTFQVPVLDGSTVVLRDVELGADGSATPGQIDTYFKGTIASASCGTSPETLTVALTNQNVTVDLDAETVIKGADASPASSCADLAGLVGTAVNVEAVTQSDGNLLAERVKVGPDSSGQAGDIGLRGVVSVIDCPTSITLLRGDSESVTVNLDASTELEDGTTCEALDGQHVKVKGVLQSDGSVTATEIELSTEGERSCEGRRDFGGGHHGPGGDDEATPTPSASPTPTPTEVPAQ